MNEADKPPLPAEFQRHLAALGSRYLAESDPLRQSGYSGGAQRWQMERSPILDAITGDGDLLDVGCANGYLLECLVQWGTARGLELTPWGVDLSAGLIELAGQRLPQFREHFFIANAWDWLPPRRFRYVYAVCDCVPAAFLERFVRHLLEHAVAQSGRLIVGAYGSRSRAEAPPPIHTLLAGFGHKVLGTAAAGVPETARFAWIDGE
jgi:SAM-dependent methyltransferase